MKTLLTLFTILVLGLTAGAQQQGSKYIGGNVGFNSSTDRSETGSTVTNDVRTTTWNVSPEVGYFLRQDISVGISLILGGVKTVDEDPTPFTESVTTTTMFYGLGLNGRKYFRMGEQFSLFAGLDLNVVPGKTEEETDPVTGSNTVETTDRLAWGINLNGGLAFNVSERFIIFGKWAGLGYAMTNEDTSGSGPDSNTKTTDFGLNVNTLGNPFNVGIYFVLP